MRYLGWRRLSGDTADRPDLLDFGKKLLGFLDNQRRLSGVKTCSIERTLPDGSVVRARFEYDIPVIEVRAGPLGSETPPTADGIKGFILCPDGVTGDHPETVLQPIGDPWRSRVFDASYQPDPPPAKSGTYSRLFPEGLPWVGNVDWRSQDESLIVSWTGPQGRYFGTTQFDKYVFRNNQLLLDSTVVAPALLGAAVLDLGIYGACVRVHEAAHWLYVMAVHAYDDGGLVHQALLRFPLSRDPFAPKTPRAPTFAMEPRWQIGDGEVLLDHTSPAADFQITPHPWVFNQSGTQARRLTKNADNEVVEQLVDLTDPTAATFNESVVPIGMRHVVDELTDLAEDYTTTTQWTEGDIVSSQRTYHAEAYSTITSHPIAVDFSDDVPVYAYGLTPSSVDDRTHSATGTAYGTEDGSGNPTTRGQSVTLTQTLTQLSYDEGLRVDWLPDIRVANSLDVQLEQTLSFDWIPTSVHTALDQTYSRTSTERTLYLLHLDLRYKMLSYATNEVIASTDRPISAAQDNPGSHGSDVGGLEAAPFTTTSSGSTTLTLRVLRDTTVLAENTIVLDDHAGDVDGTLSVVVKPWLNEVVGEDYPDGREYLDWREQLIATREAFPLNLLQRITWSDTTGAVSRTGTDSAAVDADVEPTNPIVLRDGESLAGMIGGWAIQIKHNIPDGGAVRYYGGWATLGNDWVFSQPWPDATLTEQWLNLDSTGSINTQTARPDSRYFFPLTVMAPTVVPRS